jgi:hypothetical protein
VLLRKVTCKKCQRGVKGVEEGWAVAFDKKIVGGGRSATGGRGPKLEVVDALVGNCELLLWTGGAKRFRAKGRNVGIR